MTLRRAADLVGGEQQLALRLKVKRSHLSLWVRGLCRPPADVFLLAVDLVTESEISALGDREVQRD
jgi:DNA-binding transcriptional regulator YdaS (Cro superfamily)